MGRDARGEARGGGPVGQRVRARTARTAAWGAARAGHACALSWVRAPNLLKSCLRDGRAARPAAGRARATVRRARRRATRRRTARIPPSTPPKSRQVGATAQSLLAARRAHEALVRVARGATGVHPRVPPAAPAQQAAGTPAAHCSSVAAFWRGGA